jgi:hypothetical protein
VTTAVEEDFSFFFLCSLSLMRFVTKGWGNDSLLKKSKRLCQKFSGYK